MGRSPDRFTQAELARIFAAGKPVGMAVHVDRDRAAGVAEVVPIESIPPQLPQWPAERRREFVL